MSKKRKRKSNVNIRDSTGGNTQKNNGVAFCMLDNWDLIGSAGYTSLANNPEIISAVNKIAALIGTMTIHLMSNTSNGDQRITNKLSRKIDIHPNSYMTRQTYISYLVRILLLEGDGNAVVFPETKNGLIENLYPLTPYQFTFIQNGFGYKILVNGNEYNSDSFIHIVINPDVNYPWKGTGCRKSLRDVSETLKQASQTKKSFMSDKWKPSIIVKVDANSDELSDKEGREKLLEKYIETNKAGQPWMIPAEGFDVVTVKPLSLTDLAIKDSVELDKRTVAALLDIPTFVLGVGTFNKDEWNNFVNTRIRQICMAIEQAHTNTLLINPEWYFRFNHRSLYSYDLNTLSTVGANLFTRGILTGNEIRDSIGYSPMNGLDELVILENYIPQGMIGEQKKLTVGGENDG